MIFFNHGKLFFFWFVLFLFVQYLNWMSFVGFLLWWICADQMCSFAFRLVCRHAWQDCQGIAWYLRGLYLLSHNRSSSYGNQGPDYGSTWWIPIQLSLLFVFPLYRSSHFVYHNAVLEETSSIWDVHWCCANESFDFSCAEHNAVNVFC